MKKRALSDELRHVWRVTYATAFTSHGDEVRAAMTACDAVQGACELMSEPVWGGRLSRNMAREALGDTGDCEEFIARAGDYWA